MKEQRRIMMMDFIARTATEGNPSNRILVQTEGASRIGGIFGGIEDQLQRRLNI
jgi:hypothetical protein